MRILVRRELDISKQINLRELSPMEKIWAGIMKQVTQNSFYISYKRQESEKAYIEALKEDETVKGLLLAELYAEINQNRTLKDRNLTCDTVILTVDAKYEASLKRLFPNLFGLSGEPHKDFMSFNIERVPENKDIRRAFSDMPIMLRASAKRI